MASPISVVFNADTQQFVAEVDKAGGAVSKSADAVAKAKNQILASFKMQVQAAKDVGASSEELEAIQKRSAQMMAAVTEQNANRIIGSLDRIAERNRKVAAELQNLSVPKGAESGHGFSDRMATSAVVRAGEGTTSIRAVESFITMIPGATAAAQGLATVIGGAGLLGMILELGDKGVEAFRGLRDAVKNAALAADEMHSKSRVLSDDKEIENQRIQDQIDKLSGHPNNGLAMALLEAKKNADSLAVSLQEDRKQMESLFGQQKRGMLDNALHSLFNVGPEGTSQQRKELLQGQSDLERTIGSDRANYDAALAGARDDNGRKAATAAFNKAVHRDIQARIDTLKGEYKRLGDEEKTSQQAAIDSAEAGTGYASPAIDNSLKKQNVATNIGILQDRLKVETLDASIYSGQQTLGSVKQNKAENSKAQEAARKAAEEQRNQWDIEHDQWEQATQRSAADEVAFWTAKVNAAGIGSLNYKTALDKQTEAIRSQRTKDTEAAKKAASHAEKQQRESWDLDHDQWVVAAHRTASDEANYWNARLQEAAKGSENYKAAYNRYTQAILAAQKAAEEASKARIKAQEQQGQQATAYAQATLAIQEQTGQISRHDAAIQLASVHAEQYRQQMVALQAALSEQQKLDPNSAATINAQAAITKAATDRQVQIMQDGANTAATTWEGALRSADAVWVQDAQDSAKQVKALFDQTISGVNDNLSNLMVGKKANFGEMFRGIGKTVATDGLQRLEAPALKALGINGKADGSNANPFWVRMAGQMGAAGTISTGANDITSGLKSLFGQSGDADDITSSAAGTGKVIGGAMSMVSSMASLFGGGLALGGRVKAGVPYDVGEMGRERFIPATDGTIVPHDRLTGNVAYYSVQVANGVTPEQMNMHMQTALKQFHPVVVQSSVAAVKAHQNRLPSTSR